MKRIVFVLIFIVIVISGLLAARLNVLAERDDCLRLQFCLDSYTLNSGDTAAPVKMPDEQDNLILNNYSLPVFTYMLQVPAGHKAVVHLVSPRYETRANISLSKTDAEIVTNDEYVMLSDPFVMRGNLLATLAIQPFLYKAASGSMEILQSADIGIEFVPDRAVAIAKSVRQTQEYKSWLSQSILNYRDSSRDGEATGSLIIVYNELASPLSQIQPLIDWKHQKGWEVHTISTQMAGNSTTSIKNYIQTAYDTWPNPPEYILMLGSVTQQEIVPTYYEYTNHVTVGDYKYTLLDGPDLIPDAYIGRLTFGSADELTSMINKIISYEKNVGLANTTWYSRALLISDEAQSGAGCTTNIEYIRDLMMSYNSEATYIYANSGTFPQIIMSAMAQGVSNFYYRGHYGYSGLTNNDIYSISNNGKYPFIGYITCFSGNYGDQSLLCTGECFLRSGTASVPKGAIGFIGASCETHTCLNNIMMGGIAYGFYNEGLTSQGQAEVRAKLALLACYPQYPDDYIPQNFQSINLLGDPSVDIILKQPANIAAVHPASVLAANGNMQITVTETDGTPVYAAKVCLLKGNDEIFQVGYTNSLGVYTFEWGTATEGNGKLTVTKANIKTYQSNIAFTSGTADFTLANLSAFNTLTAGTTYQIPISLTNNQYTGLTSVTANLVSASEYVDVVTGSVNLGSINLNQTSTSTQNVVFNVLSVCPQNSALSFLLQIQGMQNSSHIAYILPFMVIENGPNLVVSSTQMGGDNILNPGETSNFNIVLMNQGASVATSVTASLISYNPNVTFSLQGHSYGNIGPNQTAVNTTPFSVTAANSMYIGTKVSYEIHLSFGNGTSQSIRSTLVIGHVTSSAMTGPDEYGYVCVANNDSHPLAKPYNWIELSPAMGGTGIQINLTDNDTEGSGSWQTINLAYPFRYYGIAYNQISVCSNGFIMPGYYGSQEWMNWQIPGPMVPRPIIAPFWDDLLMTASARIFYKYDTANQRTIVEWIGLANRYNMAYTETFEVILYNSPTYQTPTGDHPILFQYQSFHNIDAGHYGVAFVDHGQYASIGIADHTGNMGIGYSYQNIYPETASPLSNNSTLYFSSIQTYNPVPIPIVQTYNITELTPVFANGQIDSGETIALSPVICNTGYSTLIPSNLTLSSSGPYVSVINNASHLGILNPQDLMQVTQPFIISISPNCPNLQQIELMLTLRAGLDYFSFRFNIQVHALQVEFGELSIDGQKAYYLAPLAITPVTLRIGNASNLPLQNGIFTFTNNDTWSVTPAQVNVNIPPEGFTDITFNLQSLNTVPAGESIIITGILNVPTGYDTLYSNPLYVGTMASLVQQDCESPEVNSSWILPNGVSFAPAAYIHQQGTEILIHPLTGVSQYSIVSPAIFAGDSQLIRINFNYLNQNLDALNSLYVSINQSPTWQLVTTFSQPFNQVSVKECYLGGLPENIRSVRFKWQTTTNGLFNGIVVMDDIQVSAIHHSPAQVSGNISLEDSSTDLTQVCIYTSEQPDIIIHPATNGHYTIPLYQGNYSLHAELDNHLTGTLPELHVVSNQLINDADFFLPYLQKPVNLTSQLQDNVLALSWQLEPLPDGAASRRVPNYYRIFIVRDGILLTINTLALSYQRNIEYGNFQVYIKSVFVNDLAQEVLSDSSNVLVFEYTDNQDINSLPAAFTLQQNFPNPFNPTTMINYSLKTGGKTSLRIYNLKGQCIRTLTDAEQKQGYYQLCFDGVDDNNHPLSSGVYYYRLTSGRQVLTRKMVLLK